MSSSSDLMRGPVLIIGLVASVLGIITFFGVSNWQELTGVLWSGSSPSSPVAIEEIAVGDCVSIDVASMNSGTAGDYEPDACEVTEGQGTFKVLGIVPYDDGAYQKWQGRGTETSSQIGNEYGSCGIAMGWDGGTSFNAFSIYTANGREVVCSQLLTE